MARSRAQGNDLVFPIVVLVGAAAWTHRAQLVYIAYIALGVMVCLLLLKLSWKIINRRRRVWRRNVDTMGGLDFEKYVAELLRANGLLIILVLSGCVWFIRRPKR